MVNMNKKIISVALASVCAATCAVALSACADKDRHKVVELSVALSDDPHNGSNSANKTIYYGETPDWNFYKLYVRYSNGDTEEIPATDGNLTVKYSFLGQHTSSTSEITALPDKVVAGTYTIEYTYEGVSNKASAHLYVAQATNGAFTVKPTVSTWYSNAKSPSATVVGPQGAPVTEVDEATGVLTDNDTTGTVLNIKYVEKSVYDGLTEAQKTDYDYMFALENSHYFEPNRDFIYEAGEYVLYATAFQTYNYRHIVTPGVPFTVKDPFVERPFTLQNIVVRDVDGNEVTDPDNEYVNMAAAMKESNRGKTIIFKSNGEVGGTADIEGLSAYRTDIGGVEPDLYAVIYLMSDGENVVGTGRLTGKTLTLEMPIQYGFYFVMTLSCQ